MTHTILGADAMEWLGTHYKTVLSTAETSGGLSIVDSLCPAGSGPPRHIHHDADETFVMLSGDAEFWLDGNSFTRGPGQTAFVPRGTPHTFRVISDTPSRHLLVFTPGGFEGFFAEMAAAQYRIPQDTQSVEESGARFHLSFTGPPLGDA